MNASSVPPVRYQPDVEVAEADEAQTAQALIDTMRKVAETVHRDEGHAYRSVHAKGHGLLLAELEVVAGLPAELAQGVFSHPGKWPVIMRLSTSPGDLLGDGVSTPRGLAIKIIGVEGDRLPGSEDEATQDFVMVNGPAFNAPNARKFLASAKLLAATTDRAPGLKHALSTVLQGAEKLVEKVGGKSATLLALGGHPETHPLGETYYTQVPLLHGPYMAKVSVAPVSAELVALTGAPVEVDDDPDGLRHAVIEHFIRSGGVWEVRVQLCVDLESMPIEDASVRWPEDRSPYLTVARLTAKPQAAWSASRSTAVDEGMSFSPWHGLAAHRPIGSVMRVRQRIYQESVRFRAERNSTRIGEPTGPDSLPA